MYYAMSDIHGCFDKYKEMLSLIEFTLRDTLYVLGDVIDRGPDGIKILQDMMLRPNVFPLLGNHEFTAAVCLPWLMEEVTDQSLAALDETQIAALSEWIANGGGVTIRSLKELSQEEREDILEYFQEMELFAQIRAGGRDFVLLHSGLGHFFPGQGAGGLRTGGLPVWPARAGHGLLPGQNSGVRPHPHPHPGRRGQDPPAGDLDRHRLRVRVQGRAVRLPVLRYHGGVLCVMKAKPNWTYTTGSSPRKSGNICAPPALSPLRKRRTSSTAAAVPSWTNTPL